MTTVPAVDEEIQAAEKVIAKGDFAAALATLQVILSRVQEDDSRMRLLFDVLSCSTRLCADRVTSNAIQELEKMSEPEMSRVFVNLIQAMSNLEFGRAKEALDLIETNLKTEFMAREDFQIWKYKHLAYKGRALVYLGRCEESVVSLTEAHAMDPNGERETEILIDQANCLFALDRYDEAYDAASQVLKRDDGEMAALAMQYMAEIRSWQRRVPEALELYIELQKRLPCRLVQEDRFQNGMSYCLAFLEKVRPPGRNN